MKISFRFLILVLFCLSIFVSGCEAFRKKFVRKPKKEKEIKVVVQTYEYEDKYSAEQAYKKYYSFWQGYHNELINLLTFQDGNRKKLLFSAKKIVENLQQMQQFLLSEQKEKLGNYILEQKKIVRQLDRTSLSRSLKLRIKNILEKQRRKIERDFAYRYIKEYLIQE